MKPESNTGFVFRINLQHGEVFKATTFPRTRATSTSFQRYVKGGFYSPDY
jgi:hypothetical protein